MQGLRVCAAGSLKSGFAGCEAALLRRASRALPVPPLDVFDYQLLEIPRHRRPAQRHGLLAVDEHRRRRSYGRSYGDSALI